MAFRTQSWSENGPPPNWNSHFFHSSVLVGLPSSARRGARILEVPARSTIFATGDRPEAIFYVLSGEVRLVRRSRSGDEIVLQQRSRYAGFLAEASLWELTYDCDAIAVKASRLLSIPRDAFVEALEFGVRHSWIAYLVRELREVRAGAERLALKTAPQRIVHYIESVGKAGVLHLNQTKKDWAADLGLTHEALYRALAQMKKRGQLTVDDRRFVLEGRTARKGTAGRAN
jgi:CRP-like cAMP-binding protein